MQISNLPAVKASIQKLEGQTSAGDLWDDPSKAQGLLQQLTRTKEQLQEVQSLQKLLDDVQTAIELAALEVQLLAAQALTVHDACCKSDGGSCCCNTNVTVYERA